MSLSRVLRSFLVLLVATWCLPAPSAAQQQEEEMMVVNQSDNPVLKAFRWRALGPIGQGGRVDDIAAVRSDPHTFFVGFATGGLWKTDNNGTTFRPVFETHETHSIGDVAIAPSDPSIVYVGTGEANNRQSASFGAGLYKSTDGGETFTYSGLRETQTIARILVHPTNPNVVWVAANGHLFGPNPERGVFKSTDGGRTWAHVLRVDDNTGATDIVMSPSNPNQLFAATYQRRRTGCCFVGGGPGSGVWSSNDGGDHWTRLEGNGLPRGTKGRIALAVTPANPTMLYAQMEVAADKEQPLSERDRQEWERRDDAGDLQPDPQWNGIWRSGDNGRSWEFRSNENGRPMYFSQIRVSPEDPDLVYVVDQNVHKSRDGGRTFEQLDGYGHVDQHAFWIDPDDHDHMMIGNDGSVDVTWDQGESWESLRDWNVGLSYHASVDMRRPYYVCTGLQDNGSWCGPSKSRSGEILPQDWYRVGGGDGFYSQVDPTDYTTVYAESQNGNARRLDLSTGETQSIRPRAPSEQNSETNIVPAPPAGTDIKWNWNTPILISPHNPRTIYMGANYFFISRDRGNTWTMSPDLTKQIDKDQVQIMGLADGLPRCSQLERGQRCILSKNDGVSDFGTGVSLSESPIIPGVLWFGTDDGNIQVSRDGGATWTEVSRNLPGGTTRDYVSRVEASYFDPATAYVSIDKHRSDDLRPYVYVTRDYGRTFQSITSNLPPVGNVNTVRQDPRNRNLLYVGTEYGFYVSFDEGGSWQRFMNGLSTVRVDDVLVHPRENDLVLSTHARGIQIMDDVTPLQMMSPEVMAEDVHFFEPRPAVQWNDDIRLARSVTGDKGWVSESPEAGTYLNYWIRQGRGGEAQITVTDVATGMPFRNMTGPAESGLNRAVWDLRGNRPPGGRGGRGGGGGGFGGGQGPAAHPGVYRVTISVNGREYSQNVTVLEDTWMDQR